MTCQTKAELCIPQGTTWAHSWAVTGVDLTGAWTAHSQVRERASAEAVLHEFTATVTDQSADGAVVTLSVTPVESSAWTWRGGVFDVELHGPDGTVYRIAAGSVRVDPEVTRD